MNIKTYILVSSWVALLKTVARSLSEKEERL